MWLAVLVPVSTKIGLATSDPGRAYVQTPMVLFLTALLGVVAWWIGTCDPWLGAMTGWSVLHLLWQPSPKAFEAVEMFVLSSVMLLAVRELAPAKRTWVFRGLWLIGGLQVCWVVMQWLGWDLTWDGFGAFHETTRPAGTFGNKNYLAAWLAILLPTTPAVLTGLFLLGLLLTTSWLALVASWVGLWVQYPAQWRLWSVWGACAIVGGWALHLAPGASWSARSEVWRTALDSLTTSDWLIGHGPGSWITSVQHWTMTRLTSVEGYFWTAHNDVLQHGFEEGLIGMALLAGWLWAHRRIWSGPMRGSLAALGVMSLAFFPFHLVTTGLVALVVLGMATHKEDRQ